MLADNEKYSTRDLTEPSSVDPAGYTDPQPPQAEESFECQEWGLLGMPAWELTLTTTIPPPPPLPPPHSTVIVSPTSGGDFEDPRPVRLPGEEICLLLVLRHILAVPPNTPAWVVWSCTGEMCTVSDNSPGSRSDI